MDKNNANQKNDDEIEIIIDDKGKDLDISPVYSHIKLEKQEDENNDSDKKIVIPEKNKPEHK